MLFRNEVLQRIADGSVTLAFRRWKRASVKTGSQLKTAAGLVLIESVRHYRLDAISKADANRARYHSVKALRTELAQRDGDVYRIELTYAGADPRIELREDTKLSDEDVEELRTQLDRYDGASRHGPWTAKILHAIELNPKLPAVELAATSGFEKEWLKTNVRKLKNLGRTISHQPGYELSPRGRAF
ncbi:MAG: ASCH domain-containing protein [Opitutales bacterium]